MRIYSPEELKTQESEHYLRRISFWPWLHGRKYRVRLARVNGMTKVGMLEDEDIIGLDGVGKDRVRIITPKRTILFDAPLEMLLVSIGIYTLDSATESIMNELARVRYAALLKKC